MRSSLEIHDLTTGTTRSVLQSDKVVEAPNWAPDCSWLLVNSEGHLFRVPLDRPRLEQIDLGEIARCNNDHGLTPDGQTIILSSHAGGQGAEIYVVPVEGGTPRKISPDRPSWWHGISPDGTTLTYVAARDQRRVIDVYTMPLAGGSETRLTMGEGHCDGPDFSADGSRIYYNCDRDGHAQIWVMAADGTGQRKLFADDHVNWFPHPSPDGRHLLYLAYPPGTTGHPADLPVALVLADPDGGNRRRIVELNGGQGTMNVPCWAPDSSAFAFVRYAKP